MDPPQRATAAQMASRNIKSARKSKLNNRIASKDPNSVPQFATPSAEGSLFGGQFALPTESSGFNFALPNPVGFQPLSFAPATKQVDEVEGVFQPGHYERDNRGGKRHTGWTPQSASIDGDYVNPEDRASEPKTYFGEDRLVAESKSVESSTKAPPQALGQSFTHSWPTATESPKASPQVLGQGFAGNWPKTTEQPATLGSAFIFSVPQQENPVPTTEANPQPIANSSTSFGSAPTQTFATLFGQTPTVSQASNMGSTASTTAPPTSNGFGHSTPSNNNIFGQQVQVKPNTPATSFFGQVQAVPPTPTSNVFGQSQPATSHNIFGHLGGTSNSVSEQPQVAASTSNIFGHVQNAPPASSMFGKVQPAPPTPASTSNMFGQVQLAPPTPTPTNNVFGQSQPAPTHNVFGHLTPSKNVPEQQPTPSSNGFGQSALPTSMASSQQNTSTSNIFGNLQNFNQTPFKSTTATQDTSNSYGSNNTNSVSYTTGNNMFNSAQPVGGIFGMAQSSNLFTPSSSAPLNSNTEQPTILSNGISGNQQSSNLFNSPSPQQPAMHEHNNSGDQRSSNPFNPSNAPSLNSVAPEPVIPSTNNFGSEQFSNLPSLSSQASSDIKTPVSTTGTSSVLASQEDPNPMPDVDSIPSLSDEAISVHMPVGLNEDEQMKFCAAFRLHTLNQAAALILSQMPATKDFTPVWNYLCEQRRKILYHVVVNSKDLPPTANSAYSPEAPLATPAPLALAASTLATAISPVPLPSTPPRGSIFSAEASEMKRKRIFDNEDQENQNPSKRTRNSEQPNYEPPSNAGRINSEQTIAPTPSLSKGKRRAEDELDQKTQQLSPLKQNLNAPTPSNSVTGQSNTSNILRSIVDTPRKTNSIKSSTVTKASQPAINPFGGLPVPSLKGEITSPKNPSAAFTVNSAPTNLFTPKSTSTISTSNIFSPKPAADAVSASPFSLKPASSSTSTNGTGAQSIKPPVFGTGSVNFMAQFGQKASADEKDSEAKLMEKDKAEDMDSDEDEEEWEAKWKAKRREELKKLKEISKTKKAKFVEGKGFVYDNSETSDSSDSATSTNSKATGQVTNSLFNSPNPSRPSTPGLRSSTGSVLGGNSGPVEKEHNIFGNLSSSNKGSGSDDPEDYASDGENGPEEDSENIDPNQGHDTDSDSNVPETKAGFGSAKSRVLQDTDKTPTRSNSVEDTENSETPKRSLFDRMNKDADGKPIRSLQTEEKENTQPTSSTIFGGTNNLFTSSLTKITSSENTQPNGGTVFGEVKNPFGSSLNSSAPTDQTWKPYSPIKFGSATTTAESAPTFSVTAATPPKSQSPSIFGSLKPQAQFTGFSSSNNTQPASSTAPPTFNFGSANQSKLNSTTSSNLFGAPASSNLFGSTTSSSLFGTATPKQSAIGSVGFGFGGSSATSSLFPSAAGSADTSRATSPGGTTDNDSGVENDPDTEKHEQINLTTGGLGEENEAVIFEVRAKLMKFDPKDKDKQWPVQGIGPLRLLKHKETGVTRVLMRSDPSGKLLLNKGILPTVSYEANGKTMKLMAASDNGKGLETYLIQVKEPEMAKKLAEELNANKNQ